MTFVHGSDTFISLNGVDLSAFCNTSELGRTADSHNCTTYGKKAHVFRGGLGNGTASMAGIYDNGVSGPRATIEPLIGEVVTLVRRPEGTGSGKPQDAVSVLIIGYTETNPVADMVAWQCQMQCSDVVTSTTQA